MPGLTSGHFFVKKLTTEEFIRKAISIHGDTYDYSLSSYIGSKTPIQILCSVHGSFWQPPNAHLIGSGCNACGYLSCSEKTRQSLDEFIEKAKKAHGEKYSYSKSVYCGAHGKLTITCPKHGDFIQDAHSHIKGAGCYQCGVIKNTDRNRSSHDYFVKKARAIHGDTYSYSAEDYKGRSYKVTVTCKIHGDFSQLAGDHLCGCGCPSCSDHGFSKNKRGFLYILKGSDYFKIGISNNISSRMKKLRQSTPFKFRLFYMEAGDGGEISNRERELHRKFLRAGLSGFDGATEWFIIEPEFMERIANDR